jgi:hypothetical protein
MMMIRWLAAAISIAALSGCAYPSFNRDSFDMQVRTMTLDPRFPLLKAYKECVVDNDGGENSCKAANWSRYYFAHFDPASRDRTPIITSHYSDYRSFTGTADLVPSYSVNPGMRMLDTFVEPDSNYCYQQHVVFYRNQAAAEDSDGHRLSFQLRGGGCVQPERGGPRRGAGDLLQDVKFVVVFGGRAMIFVALKNATPETKGLTVRDVLGDVSGIPAELTAQAYRVYRVDTTPDSLRSGSAILVKAPLCTPERPAASGDDGRGACPNPSGTLAVQRDPMPHIALETGAQQFNCHVRTSSTDWHLFGGMAATALGKFDFSQRCTPAK